MRCGRREAPPRRPRPRTVRIPGAHTLYRNAFAVCLAGAAVPPVAVAAVLPLHRETDGVGWALLLASAAQAPLGRAAGLVVALAAVGFLTGALLALPGMLARREVAVDADGLVLTEHGLLWREERAAAVPWEDVALVLHREAVANAGPWPRRCGVLDLFLRRRPIGLPGFALCVDAGPEDARGGDGRPLAPFLLRLGGGGPSAEDAVRTTAALAGLHHPELFRPGPDVAIGPARASAAAPDGRRLAAVAGLAAAAEATALALLITEAARM